MLRLLTLCSLLPGSLVVLSGASGCALTVDRIILNYPPQPQVPRVAGAEKVAVAVFVRDARKDPSRVSVKKNGYGMEMAAIVSDTNVAEFVGRNLQWELGRRGFRAGDHAGNRTGNDDVFIAVDLRRFYNDFKIGFFTGDADAEVVFDVIASRRRNGVGDPPIYIGHFEGAARNASIGLCSGENAKVALEAAFVEVMRNVFADGRLVAAVAASAPPPPPPPVNPASLVSS